MQENYSISDRNREAIVRIVESIVGLITIYIQTRSIRRKFDKK